MKKGNEFLKEFFSESSSNKKEEVETVKEEKSKTITKDTSNFTFEQIIDIKPKTNENKSSLSLSKEKKKNGWDDEDNEDDLPQIVPKQAKKIQKITKIEKSNLDSLLDD